MKKVVLGLTTCAFLALAMLGCTKPKKKNNLDAKALVGAWQLDRIEYQDGDETKTLKPESKGSASLFEKSSDQTGGLEQIEITDSHIFLIQSDGIHFSRIGLPYSVQNRVIVTQDSENTQISDLTVLSVNSSELVVKPNEAAEDSKLKDTLAVYKKIDSKELNSQKAKIASYEQKYAYSVSTEDNENIETFEIQKIGDVNLDFEKEGGVELILCEYDLDTKEVSINLVKGTIEKSKEEGKGNHFTQGRPSVLMSFNMDLQQIGDGEHSAENEKVDLILNLEKNEQSIIDQNESCNIAFDLNGAEMDLSADCKGTTQEKAHTVKVDAQCLLRIKNHFLSEIRD